MNERVIELRKILNLTQEQFANKIGLKRTSLSSIELHKCNVSETVIISICSKFSVNETWLRTGEGEMFNIKDQKFQEFWNIYSKLSPPLQDFILTTIAELLNTQDKL